MCKAVQDLQEKAAETARNEMRIQTVEKLLRCGKMSIEEIAEDKEISIEEVEEIDRRRSA